MCIAHCIIVKTMITHSFSINISVYSNANTIMYVVSFQLQMWSSQILQFSDYYRRQRTDTCTSIYLAGVCPGCSPVALSHGHAKEAWRQGDWHHFGIDLEPLMDAEDDGEGEQIGLRSDISLDLPAVPREACCTHHRHPG